MSSKSDLRRARELYEELRQMSVETGGSIENLMEGINTSHESVASIIPYEKRQELSKFELSLKQMIEEAKQMATTPTSGSEEDLSYRKSPSVHSLAESIVSVIERRNSSPRYIILFENYQKCLICNFVLKLKITLPFGSMELYHNYNKKGQSFALNFL